MKITIHGFLPEHQAEYNMPEDEGILYVFIDSKVDLSEGSISLGNLLSITYCSDLKIETAELISLHSKNTGFEKEDKVCFGYSLVGDIEDRNNLSLSSIAKALSAHYVFNNSNSLNGNRTKVQLYLKELNWKMGGKIIPHFKNSMPSSIFIFRCIYLKVE